MTKQGAQKQHYISKFMLRNFLTNEAKEQVSVMDKQTGKPFPTNIHGIMAERRFNEFVINDEWLASFEPAICRIEDQVLPTYRDVVDNRRLTGSMEERVNLAFLMAFQLVRTKGQRDIFNEMNAAVRDKFNRMGVVADEQFEDASEDELKVRHADFMRNSLKDLTGIIAEKTLLLAEPAPGRYFYLGDNPLILNKSRSLDNKSDQFWGIGLATLGVEVYLPLAKDLMLCAWCPSIIEQVEASHDEAKNEFDRLIVQGLTSGRINVSQVKQIREVWEAQEQNPVHLLTAIKDGTPVDSKPTNMDLYNNLQMHFATRFVICPHEDYGTARAFIKQNPKHVGKRLVAS